MNVNRQENEMRPRAMVKKSPKTRQIAATIAASLGAALVQAHAPDKLLFAPPTDLPAAAREGGEAMFLFGAVDGRTLLYIEQSGGSRLAALDVTDPGQIRAQGTVALDSAGPFDFVAPVGDRAELIRYRGDHHDAVLDLHRPEAPTLAVLPTTLQGQVTPLGEDGFVVAGRTAADSGTLDYQVIEAGATGNPGRAFDVKQVREEVTNPDTGTTFLLSTNGLFLVRRPAVEADKRRRDEDRQLELRR